MSIFVLYTSRGCNNYYKHLAVASYAFLFFYIVLKQIRVVLNQVSEFFLLSFCVRYERTFIDVRVFNPHADSNRTSSISATYQKHENEKRRMYEQRVHVLSATGGMARQASVLYKRLASLLAEKRDATY